MLEFYSADVLGQEYNTLYPHRTEVMDEASLLSAVKTDYVCAEYSNYLRSNENFIKSNCLAFDIDNDESEDRSMWVTPEDIIRNFPNVTMAFHYSRHHMIDKHYVDYSTGEILKTVTSRPRFHVFFEIVSVYDFEEYKALKEKALTIFPYFDKYAFRCFLLRLGFIGDEYKADRKVLLKNLTGSSAFRSGKKGGDAQ